MMNALKRTVSILTVIITGLIACTAAVAESSGVDKVAARAEVDKAYTAMIQAYADNDVEAYFGFFADDAMMLTNQGVDKPASQYHEEWSSLIAAGGGVVSIDPNFPRSIRIGDDGKTAIVSIASIPASYRFPDGSDAGKFNNASYKWAETIVWTKNDGNWKLVHFHFHDVGD